CHQAQERSFASPLGFVARTTGKLGWQNDRQARVANRPACPGFKQALLACRAENVGFGMTQKKFHDCSDRRNILFHKRFGWYSRRQRSPIWLLARPLFYPPLIQAVRLG